MNLFYKLIQLLIDENESLYLGEIIQCLPDYEGWQIKEAIETGIIAEIIKKNDSFEKFGLR